MTCYIVSGCILYVVLIAFPLTPENTPFRVHHQQNPYVLKLFSEITFILLNPNLGMP